MSTTKKNWNGFLYRGPISENGYLISSNTIGEECFMVSRSGSFERSGLLVSVGGPMIEKLTFSWEPYDSNA